VEVGARGLRRAGEEAAEGLEAAVVPAAGAQAELEGGRRRRKRRRRRRRRRFAPCWRGEPLPTSYTATAWAAA
tara:strand:+ start:468 stop:686 length:219 start_codon:yes stop_codon:yes gene_type:complete